MNTYNTLGAFSDQPELAPDIEAQIFDWLREFQDDLSDHLDEALRLGGHLQWVVDLVERAKTEKTKRRNLGRRMCPYPLQRPIVDRRQWLHTRNRSRRVRAGERHRSCHRPPSWRPHHPSLVR